MPASATEAGEAAVRAAFAEQAHWAERLGSPFTARLCALLGERLDERTKAGRKTLGWRGRPEAGADALPLRLCGGLHALVRSGAAPALAACYPPNPQPDPERLWAAVARALREPGLPRWIERAPQTNEVGRSAVLMAGLLAVAARHDLPVELLELGASAGLNLLLDRYRYDLGGLQAGDPASPLRLKPDWKGAAAPPARVVVARRRGVDLRPLDARRDGEGLLAYVWPDQPARLAQLGQALAIATADPPEIEQGDAAEWLDARLSEPAARGSARVVLHSVAFQYFPAQAKARIAASMASAGAAASRAAPLAWLRFEKRRQDERYSLRLRLWPDGEDRLLAWGHPHGSAIRWLGG